MNESFAATSDMLICDKQGDAILKVQDRLQIRVSSKVLSVASPVFRAMFDGRFQEGQELDSINPPIVLLPEDDVIAMATLCTILHWKTPHVRDPDPSQLLKLAILADKYQCIIAIEVFAKRLADLVSNDKQPTQDLYDLLMFSYYLHSEENFKIISNRLVMTAISVTDIGNLAYQPLAAGDFEMVIRQLMVLDGHLCRRLVSCCNDMRKQGRYRLMNGLLNCSRSRLESVQENLEKFEQTLVLKDSLQRTIEDVEETLSTGFVVLHSGFEDTAWYAEVTSKFLKTWITSTTALKRQGLCLQCVREGKHNPNFEEHVHSVEQQSASAVQAPSADNEYLDATHT